MNSLIKVSILLVAAFANYVVAEEEEMSRGVMAAIFRTYDTPVDEEPDCQPEYVDEKICPTDEKIPCAEFPEIHDYCREKLGEQIFEESGSVEIEKGLNAIEGCIKYVGYHVVDLNHLACCPSEYCENWLEELYARLPDYYDDDEEGDVGEDYYKEEGEEF